MLSARVAVLALAARALAVPRTTVERTMQDRDGDNLLEPAPGEDYTVTSLSPPAATSRTSVRFGELTCRLPCGRART